MAPPELRTSRSVPILRIEAASSSSNSNSDSDFSNTLPRESSPDTQQKESLVDPVTTEHINRPRSVTDPPLHPLTQSRKSSLPLTRSLRTIPSSLTLPNLRHKISKSALDSTPYELTEEYFPASTPLENKRVGSEDEEWDPKLAIDVLEKNLLKTYDKNKPIDRKLYHPMFRILEFTRGLIADYNALEGDAEDRIQRTLGEAFVAMEEGFDPIKEMYLDEIKRIERAVLEKFGVAEAVKIRGETLLTGDMRRRPKRVKERREREWKCGWDPNDLENDPDGDYRLGRDLITGKELGEDYGQELRGSDSGESTSTHEKGKVGREMLRSKESEESLNEVLQNEAGDLSFLDNPSGRRIVDESPLAEALRPQDSQATLVPGHDYDRGRIRAVDCGTLERPSAKRGILRTVDSDDTLITRREHRSRRIQFAEGDRLERGRTNRRRTHPSLRVADSEETLVDREAMDDMRNGLARAGFM